MNFDQWPLFLQYSVYAGVGLLFLFLVFLSIEQVRTRFFLHRHLKPKIDRNYYLVLDLKHETARFEHPLMSIQKEITFTFSLMQKHMSEKHWQLLQEWIGKAQKNVLKHNDSISIFLNWRHRQIRRWLRIGYYSYDANNLKIKCSAENLFGSQTHFYAINPNQLTDLVEFGQALNQLQTESPHAGVLLNLYNPQIPLLHQHYGRETANHYMMAVWTDLERLATKNRIISYQFGGHYLIYSHEGASDHAIHELLNVILQKVKKEYEFDRFRFPVPFQVGILRVAAPISPLTDTLNDLHKAAFAAKTLGYPITFVDLETINQQTLTASQHLANFTALLDKKTFRYTYDSVYSIPSGMIHGYHVKIRSLFEDKDLDLQGLFDVARHLHLEKELLTAIFSEMVSRFMRSNLEPRHLLVYLPTDQLETFTSLVGSIMSNNPLRLSLIGDDVPSFAGLYRTRKLEALVEDLSEHNIRLGAKATPELASTFYPYSTYFSYLAMEDLADNVETNVQKQWTIQAVLTSFQNQHIMGLAPQVRTYEQAETLRNLGVGIQSGDFFNQLSGKKYSAAIRKFQRLLDIEGIE